MAEGNSDSVTASMEGKLCSAGNESLSSPGRFCCPSQGWIRTGSVLEVLGGLRARSSHNDAGPGTVGGGRQPEGAGLKSPRSAREAVSAPWKQVWLCGKCFLVISLCWLFVLQVCLHTNWHLLPWLIVHPDPTSPVWARRWPWAPDVTTDRGSVS